jgi:hypothetical protein
MAGNTEDSELIGTTMSHHMTAVDDGESGGLLLSGENDRNNPRGAGAIWKRWSHRVSNFRVSTLRAMEKNSKRRSNNNNDSQRPDSLAYNFVLTTDDDDEDSSPSKTNHPSQRARVRAKLEDAWWH